jgi:adenylate cyclase
MRIGLGGSSRRQTRLIRHTLILLALAVVLGLLSLFDPFSSFSWKLSDRLFVPESAPPQIVVVAIDDETLEDLDARGASEMARSHHADLVERLNEAEARVIAFDLLFAQSTDDDAHLADVMGQAGNIILPVAGSQALSGGGDDIVFQDVIPSVTELHEAAAATGHVNVAPDGDGVVRRLPLVVSDAVGESYPAFALSVLDIYLYAWDLPEAYVAEGGTLELLGRSIPVDSAKGMRINYVGGPQTVTTLSYGDILRGEFDADQVRDKIVLIGVESTGEADSVLTPASAAEMPGVEVHANAVDTILRQRYLVDASSLLTLVIILLMGCIAALSLPRLKLWWGGLLTVGMIALYLIVVLITFEQGRVLNLLYPPVSVMVIYVGAVVSTAVSEREKQREVRDLFGKYVSPEVAKEIMQMSDASSLRLGGEQREATILFADVRGFTSLSEERSPEAVVELLNTYFSLIVERVLAEGGMVNKFGGDNILVVWNAPKFQEDHAFAAVRAAVEAQQAIGRIQEEQPDLPKLQFGLGINTGEVLAGNVGSEGRLEYTVIGDSVNLAARLCGAAPGGQVWITAQTYEQVKGRVQVRQLDPQYFKGKSEAVVVYEVLGLDSS